MNIRQSEIRKQQERDAAQKSAVQASREQWILLAMVSIVIAVILRLL